MRIGVYGLGYVGAVTVGCLAEMGHRVTGVDVNIDKVDAILAGRAPVVEPGLDALLARHVASGAISATFDGVGVAADVDLAIIAVGTPSTPTGGIDPSYLLAVARQIGAGIARNERPFVAVASRSTSLPGVHRAVIDELEGSSGRRHGEGFGYACHPEFLRETTAIDDFFDPPMIVFGADDEATFERCRALYTRPFAAPMIHIGIGEAAMVKYAANCFHAAKVTFANELGVLCRRSGIDARTVMDVFCQDDKLNISSRYLRPGNPFGGSCLPKDLRAVLDAARREALVLPMLQGALLSNLNQIAEIGDRILAERPSRVAVIGLSFKEGTDDLREAPMIPVVERLLGKGVDVAIYDDGLVVEELHGQNAAFALSSVPHLADLVTDDLSAVLRDADVVVINHQRRGRIDWANAVAGAPCRVIDLVGLSDLEHHEGYDGLFWPGVRAAPVVVA